MREYFPKPKSLRANVKVKLREYFPKPKSLGGNVKVKLDFSNYATKADLKYATGVDTSDFAKKTDLANLKSDVEFKNVPSGLSS